VDDRTIYSSGSLDRRRNMFIVHLIVQMMPKNFCMTHLHAAIDHNVISVLLRTVMLIKISIHTSTGQTNIGEIFLKKKKDAGRVQEDGYNLWKINVCSVKI
jgi:hypothetical protein